MNYIDDINIEKLKKMNKEEMEQLAKEIRVFLLEKVTKTGGHLASNLGIVELTLAIHYVFDSPKDKILFDVGHQAYTHKILTGRKDGFDSLRQYGGMSGFPRRNESEHDAFSMGHSSNSISAAAGIARIRDILHEDYSVVAVIGDGALSGGMAMEAFNDAGYAKNKMIVILNDNEMSIAKNVGAMAGFLGRIRTIKSYKKFKTNFISILENIPVVGMKLRKSIANMKNNLKYLILPNTFFEEMGFTYIGLLDGHDIQSLIESLNDAKNNDESVILHIKTKKGCGCKDAEQHPEIYHGVGANFFEKKPSTTKSNGKVFVDKLIEMAEKDERICGITAAMPHGTCLIDFEEKFPERFMDVGIAEQHATTLAAGIACGGGRPYFAVYSTFLQRAYDQIFHDVCLQNLPVVFMIDRAGLVGNDGETHHGVFDISYLRAFPNMTIMAPSSAKELEDMMEMTLTFDSPASIRYAKTNLYKDFGIETKYGKWKELRPVTDVTIVAVGDMVERADKACDILKEKYNIEAGLVNACFIKPMDSEMIERLSKCKNIITVENNMIAGGFGSGLMEELTHCNFNGQVSLFGIPDRFVTHGNVDQLMEELELHPEGIANRVVDILER